ncbi:HK97 family phage prohead protease [Paenibacillus validus]|uniref:HK97 family phage prohead protease n=1 Tax=Paenibacillus validus TaxID=44253 RepID=UPI000FDAADE9|nr:HK97 family phage prohead protease [Paenibacillus validus]MED4599878.1 HK97 family phage prohead protease [Paenibacillus validus]MED4606089.1 HK97 family phage prohead protease [Paenibacillus validus]
MQTGDKKSPLSSQSMRKVQYEGDRSRFRAITEEVDGQQVRRIRGYAILFGVIGRPWRGSEWVEKVDKDALSGVDFSKLVILWNHNPDWILGRSGKNLRTVVDDTGLFVDVTLGNTWIDDYVFDRVEKEIVDGMSFWFDNKAIVASDWANKIDVIVKINEVYEVSIVPFPAYDETVVIAEEVAGDPEPNNPNPEPEPTPDTEDEARKQALINLIEQL